MIIGISGKKQCGKDTICKIIQAIDIYEKATSMGLSNLSKSKKDFIKEVIENPKFCSVESKFEKHSFADKLKEMASVLVGCPIEKWESGDFKNGYCSSLTFGPIIFTNREILQKIGEGLREKLHPDIWVLSLFNNYFKKTYPDINKSGKPELCERYPYWIIPDVRMPNEAEKIKELGGILIRVNRDTGYVDTHISEIALDSCKKFDFIIDNNGSLEELIEKVIDIYSHIV